MSVGFTTFFPKQSNTVFKVMNIAPNNKRIKIFNLPIPNGGVRDLLATPEVSEADIRHALLKGELFRKIVVGEIRIVESNIDLLQFDNTQKQFLINAGVTDGLTPAFEVPWLLKSNIELLGDRDGVNRIFTVPFGDKFLDGEFNGNVFTITINHNGRTLVKNIDFTIFESGGVGTGYDSINTIALIPTVNSALYATYTIANTTE